MPPMRRPPGSLVPLYLWLQAIAIAAWWAWLWAVPAARAPFVAAGWPEATLLAFALPDAVVLVIGSAAAALGLRAQRSWARPLLFGVAGAVAYATLWCVGTNLVTGAGWLSTGMMLACSAGTAWATAAARR